MEENCTVGRLKIVREGAPRRSVILSAGAEGSRSSSRKKRGASGGGKKSATGTKETGIPFMDGAECFVVEWLHLR